jgi:glucose-1-phosphate thymidylyltransferase
MKAVILAAGEGNRLRPFTETMPKVMLPVANKPILEYVVDALKKSGIREIVIVVGYKKEVIMEHFKDYKEVKIVYVTQDKQLGTAHALLQAKKHIKGDFIVVSGDNIIDHKGISNLIKDKSKYSILIKQREHSLRYGAVSLEKDLLKGISYKPDRKSKFISTGIYKLPSAIFKDIEKKGLEGIYDLTNFIQSFIDEGKEIKVVNADLWMEFVYPWDLIHVNEFMTHFTPSSINGVVEKGVTIKGPVSVGKNTTIYSGCYIVGPVSIGEGCEIGPNACIFPSTTIGNDSVIHPFSEIRNSVILDDSQIGSNSYISHSIIGRGCNIGNNFSSMVGKSVKKMEDKFDELENIGSMIGEHCTINDHVVIEPGIIIGRNCNISSMKRIIENIPSESKVM